MKQIKQTPTEKLTFKTQTLRKLSDAMTPDQLQQVGGGQRDSAMSRPTVMCG